MKNSSIPKFHQKDKKERIKIVGKLCNLSEDELQFLEKTSGGISFEQADKMVENAIGTFSLPLGIATNFQIDGKDYLIPMVIEEPSVIAAASKAAKIARIQGGFKTKSDEPYSIGQVQVVNCDIETSIKNITKAEKEILEVANSKSNTLAKMNRGAKKVSCKKIDTEKGHMLIVELIIDVGDAMGANVTNSMCEAVAPLIEKLSGGKVILKILSNYATKRKVKASAIFEKEALGGEEIVDKIILAYQFAEYDEYRAVTHNKGIMNGTIAVGQATGQDTRAIEAAANAFAVRDGKYRSLSRWTKNKQGNLVGELELPLSVGIVGGITNVHPMAKICIKILGVKSSSELAGVLASVGLGQNLSALRALASEGIQKGHMKLHAKNLASAAGAKGEHLDKIVKVMIQENNISLNRAKELLDQI